MPEVLQIIFISALPVVELRGAIPVAMLTYDFSPISAFLLSVLGNLLPVFFLLTLLPKVEELCRKYSKHLNTLLNWWYKRVFNKHKKKFETWGSLALITLVAIPLPMTGAWTGSLAAHLFKIPLKLSFLYILVGVLIAGVIVTLLTIAGINIF